MSDDHENEVISELQDEIHSLELSLNQIQREKFELENEHKELKTKFTENAKKLNELQSSQKSNADKIIELELDLEKARAVLMMNQKEYDSSHSQTDESEFAKIKDAAKKKRPAVSIPSPQGSIKESPFNTEIPKSAPVNEQATPITQSHPKSANASDMVSASDLLDIIDLLKEENSILKQRIQHTQDVKYVKNRRSSLLQGGEVTL